MKVLSSYIFRSVCAVLVGCLLAFNPQQITTLLVQLIGGLFFLSGLGSLLNYVRWQYVKNTNYAPLFPVVGVGSLLFGLFLVFFPSYFITYLMFMLGGLLVVAGVSQLGVLLNYRRVMPLMWITTVVPVLVLCVGLYILFQPMDSASMPFVVLGIASIVYGVFEMINGIRLNRYSRLADETTTFEEVE